MLEQMVNQEIKDFYFFSDFLRRRVYDTSGRKVGRIADLVVERVEPYPMIIGVVIRKKRGEKRLYLPWETITRMEPQVTLRQNDLSLLL